MGIIVDVLIERATAALGATTHDRPSPLMIRRRARVQWWLDYGAPERRARYIEGDVGWLEDSVKTIRIARMYRQGAGLQCD